MDQKFPTSICVDVQQKHLFRTYAKALPLRGKGGNVGYVLFDGEKARVCFLYPPLIRRICTSETDIAFKLHLHNHDVLVMSEEVVESQTGTPIVSLKDLESFLAPYGWSKPFYPENVYELLFPASSSVLFDAKKKGAEACVEECRSKESCEYEFPAREELLKKIPVREGLPRLRPTDLSPDISWPSEKDMIWKERVLTRDTLIPTVGDTD